jgi:hypothetical protein
MPEDAFALFRTSVRDDRDLQETLQEQRDWETFVPVALAAARERGVPLTEEDLQRARDAARREWFERWI